MLRYVKYTLLVLLGLALLTVALANRGAVTLSILPQDLGSLVGWNWTAEVPLFAVLFGGAVIGLLIGVVGEWIREHRQRAEAAEMRRRLERAERELARLRGGSGQPADELIALVEGGAKPR